MINEEAAVVETGAGGAALKLSLIEETVVGTGTGVELEIDSMCSATRLMVDARPCVVRSRRMELAAIRRNRVSDEELEAV